MTRNATTTAKKPLRDRRFSTRFAIAFVNAAVARGCTVAQARLRYLEFLGRTGTPREQRSPAAT